jgi:hypothetical protein
MMQAFFQTYSPLAFLNYLMKALQIDPSDIMRSDETTSSPRNLAGNLPAEMAALPMFQQLTNSKGEGAAGTSNLGGEGGQIAEVNQEINPLSGMTANQ